MAIWCNRQSRPPLKCLLWTLLVVLSTADAKPAATSNITLAMREAELAEVMEMLSRQNRVNILLANDVKATVSFSLYDVPIDQAIRSIASAAGYEVERREGTYFIVTDDDAGKRPGSDFTIMRAFPIQYADPALLENKLGDYLSGFGKVTALPERKLLMVEDQPAFLYRVAEILTQLDQRPRQVMIEAKVLEVTLTDEDSYGIDWGIFFDTDRGTGAVGTQGLSSPGNSGGAGLFFDYFQPDYDVALRALETDGRIRNLASPKLVTIENKEAEVIIGDRRGYRVTTTINQVTTESIEFLESGVILRVTPTIDDSGRILLQIHPEVSTGTVDESGLPSQTTTEVTTELVLNSGQSIFIGGLIRTTSTEGRSGVPVLGKIPVVRWVFSNKTRTTTNVETVVIITPRLVDEDIQEFSDQQVEEIEKVEDELAEDAAVIEREVEDAFTPEFGASRERERNTQFETTTSDDIVAESPGEESESNLARVTTALGDPTKPGPGTIAINLLTSADPIDPESLPLGLDSLDRQLYVAEADIGEMTWFRLRLGFFDETAEAAALLDELKSVFPSGSIVEVATVEHEVAERNSVRIGDLQTKNSKRGSPDQPD